MDQEPATPREYFARAAEAERRGSFISRLAAMMWRDLAAEAYRALAEEQAR